MSFDINDIPKLTSRFFGDGVTNIGTYLQLSNMIDCFNYQTKPFEKIIAYVPWCFQFLNCLTDINEKQKFLFKEVNFILRHDLPVHISGDALMNSDFLKVTKVFKDNNYMEVFCVSPPKGEYISRSYINDNDVFQFNDGVPGCPNMRMMDEYNKTACASIQFSPYKHYYDNSDEIFFIPKIPFCVDGPHRNINEEIKPGMTISGPASHRCGVIFEADENDMPTKNIMRICFPL